MEKKKKEGESRAAEATKRRRSLFKKKGPREEHGGGNSRQGVTRAPAKGNDAKNSLCCESMYEKTQTIKINGEAVVVCVPLDRPRKSKNAGRKGDPMDTKISTSTKGGCSFHTRGTSVADPIEIEAPLRLYGRSATRGNHVETPAKSAIALYQHQRENT